jgi:hypothetical protein
VISIDNIDQYKEDNIDQYKEDNIMRLELVSAKEIETKKPPGKKDTPVKKEPTPIRRAGGIPLIEAEEVIPARLTREPTGAKAIIPTGDTCCFGVCTHLNTEIDGLSQAIKIRQEELKFMSMGSSRLKTKRQIMALTNEISSLKDLRFTLANKNVCKCIELPKGK